MKKETLLIILALAILGAIVLVIVLVFKFKFDKSNNEINDSDIQEQIDEMFESRDKCFGDIYNCNDFTTQQDAQDTFELCGGLEGNDIHRLDSDNDGVVCEGLL